MVYRLQHVYLFITTTTRQLSTFNCLSQQQQTTTEECSKTSESWQRSLGTELHWPYTLQSPSHKHSN